MFEQFCSTFHVRALPAVAKNKVVLSLPMFPELTKDEQKQVVDTLKAAINSSKVAV